MRRSSQVCSRVRSHSAARKVPATSRRAMQAYGYLLLEGGHAARDAAAILLKCQPAGSEHQRW